MMIFAAAMAWILYGLSLTRLQIVPSALPHFDRWMKKSLPRSWAIKNGRCRTDVNISSALRPSAPSRDFLVGLIRMQCWASPAGTIC